MRIVRGFGESCETHSGRARYVQKRRVHAADTCKGTLSTCCHFRLVAPNEDRLPLQIEEIWTDMHKAARAKHPLITFLYFPPFHQSYSAFRGNLARGTVHSG